MWLVLQGARVGTRCDLLLDALNISTLRNLEFHDRLDAIVLSLSRLDRGQGLGFCVAGVSLNKKNVVVIFAKMASVIIVGIPWITGVLEVQARGHEQCELTGKHRAALELAAAAFNATDCSYDVRTVAEFLPLA
jgi:hypothetical protein